MTIPDPEVDTSSTLFPLRLNSVERLMVREHCESYPVAFLIRLVFKGVLDRSALLSATREALQNHPLLHARIQGSGYKDLRWVPADCPPVVEFTDAESRPGNGSLEFDLWRMPGLKTTVSENPDSIAVRFHFHHACCDGIGALEFIEDLFCRYHSLVEPDSGIGPRPRCVMSLMRRSAFGLTRVSAALRLPLEVLGATIFAPFVWRRTPVAFASPRKRERAIGPVGPFPDYFTHTFSPSQSTALKAAARTQRGTVTHLLLRDFFLSIQRWQDRNGGQADEWIRIMVPTNLRSMRERTMPAVNCSCMLPVDRRPGRHRSPEALLRTFRLGFGFARGLQTSRILLRSFQFAAFLPNFIEYMISPERTWATALLTNLGQPGHDTPLPRVGSRVRAGNLLLVHGDGAAPVRPKTSLALAVVSYDQKLTVCLSYDDNFLSGSDATAFMAMLVTRIKKTASAQEGRVPVDDPRRQTPNAP